MQEEEALHLKTIIGSLFDIVGYKPSSSPQLVQSHSDALEKAVGEEVRSWNVDDGHDGVVFASIIKKAVSLVEV